VERKGGWQAEKDGQEMLHGDSDFLRKERNITNSLVGFYTTFGRVLLETCHGHRQTTAKGLKNFL
jgi:hypothetical protein